MCGLGFGIIQSDIITDAPWPKPPNPRQSPELGRLAGKRIMRDDGICHHLHCPGKILLDRATREGLVMSHGQVTGRFLRFVHQSKKTHNQFVTKAAFDGGGALFLLAR